MKNSDFFPARIVLFLVFAAAFLPASAAAELRMEADVSDRLLSVYVDGELFRTYDVAVGKRAHPTPTGSFTIQKLIWNPSWVPPNSSWARGKKAAGPGDPNNPMKVVKIFFREPDYYIHGTDDVDSIGEAASHGCIRMTPSDVEELARLIMEKGGEGRSERWYSETVSSTETKVVRLEWPITLEVRD